MKHCISIFGDDGINIKIAYYGKHRRPVYYKITDRSGMSRSRSDNITLKGDLFLKIRIKREWERIFALYDPAKHAFIGYAHGVDSEGRVANSFAAIYINAAMEARGFICHRNAILDWEPLRLQPKKYKGSLLARMDKVAGVAR